MRTELLFAKRICARTLNVFMAEPVTLTSPRISHSVCALTACTTAGAVKWINVRRHFVKMVVQVSERMANVCAAAQMSILGASVKCP